MTRHTILCVCTKAIIILALGAFSQIDAQTLRSLVEPQARLFPSIGPGVTAVKRDASGRYYILGKPANVVSVYDSGGNLIGQIPNQKSGVSIRYAVGIDLTSDGKLVVADRGANAIEAFNSDGSLIAKIPVVAPTSVVALPGGLFAVTSLSSDHLVQILDETGSVVRSFGSPSDVEDSPSTASESETERRPMVDWGKIVGSSTGDIYFAFTSLPEPLVRRYDQYGAAGFEASVPKELSDRGPSSKQDRVEFSVNFSHLSLSDQTVGSVTVGSSGDVRFTGGMGTGLSRMMGGGGSFGRAAAQMSLMQAGNGSVANGMTAGSIGGMFSGQITKQGAQIQLGAGNISSVRGGRGRRGGNLNGNFDYDLAAPQGSTLQFFGSSRSNAGSNGNADSNSNTGSGTNADANNTDGFSTQALAYSGSDSSGSDFSGSGAALQSGSIDESALFPNATDAGEAASLSAAFAYGALSNSIGFSPAGLGRPGGGFGRFPGGGMGHGGFGGGGMEHFQGNAFGDGQFRPHHFGAGEGDITATVRVNLGDLGNSAAAEKATITATAVDSSGDLWVAVGDTLIHYSKDGIALDTYYLALKGGQPLKPTALVIEPDRFIVAADPWGIFEFSRTPQ